MSKPSNTRWLATALLALPFAAFAGPKAGSPDPSFGDQDPTRPGTVVRGFNNGLKHDFADEVLQTASGRLVVIGLAKTAGGESCIGLMQFSADGVPDPTDFGFDQNDVPTGKVCHPGLFAPGVAPFSNLETLAQPDGRLLVSGGILPQGQTPQVFLCRFLATGRIDEQFGDQGGCRILPGSYAAPPLLLMVHGEIGVISTMVNTMSPSSEMYFQRFAVSNGAVLPFGQHDKIELFAGHPDLVAFPIPAQARMTAAGHIAVAIAEGDEPGAVAVGLFEPEHGESIAGFGNGGLVRVDIDAVEQGFDYTAAVEVLPDDKLLVAAQYEDADGLRGIALLQLLPDGKPDPGFNEGSPLLMSPCATLPDGCSLSFPIQLARMHDGDVVIGGSATFDVEPDRALTIHLDAAGSPKAGFGPTGVSSAEWAAESGYAQSPDMLLQDDRVIFTGTVVSTDLILTDEDNDGTDEFVQIEHADFALLRLAGNHLFRDGLESQP